MVYRWREGYRFPVSAQVAGERIALLREANDECVLPQAVVDDARPEDSPLHSCFVWDPERAMDLYNRARARKLIVNVVPVEVTFVNGPKEPPRTVEYHVAPKEERPKQVGSPPGHVRVHRPTDGQSVYVTTSRALADEVMRAEVLREALRGLKAWRARYAALKELSEVFAAIDNLDGCEAKAGHLTARR